MNKNEEYIIKSLEFLQNIIARLNNNSSNVKVFATTIFGILVALYFEKKDIIFIYICIICMVSFALMDSRFLYNERKFREIYNNIIENSNDECLKVFKYELDGIKNVSYLRTTFSFSILLLYLSVILSLLVIIVINYI